MNSPGARSLGNGFWLLQLELFEDSLQRQLIRVAFGESAQRSYQYRAFGIGKLQHAHKTT
jgi:hypothetical protein